MESLVLLLILAAPVAALLFWLRRPSGGGVPRDALASRAKASASGPGLLVWPTKAYRKTLIDDAADLPGAPPGDDTTRT
jgi:hypothetical protein